MADHNSFFMSFSVFCVFKFLAFLIYEYMLQNGYKTHERREVGRFFTWMNKFISCIKINSSVLLLHLRIMSGNSSGSLFHTSDCLVLVITQYVSRPVDWLLGLILWNQWRITISFYVFADLWLELGEVLFLTFGVGFGLCADMLQEWVS